MKSSTEKISKALPLVFFLFIFCLSTISVFGEQKKLKFGNPSKEELLMTEYEQDKEAEAVFLHEANKIEYEIGSSGIKLVYSRELRIKILKDSGKSWASFVIPYREREESKDIFAELKGCAVNFVEGKIKKTELTKDMITSEEVRESYLLKKFTIPDVHAGTIIDVKYKVKSDFITNIPSVNIQHSIPVKYCYYEMALPDYMVIDVHPRCYIPLNIYRTQTSHIVPNAPDMPYETEVTIIEQENIPALRSADYVYCLDDYYCGFDFEVLAIELFDLIDEDVSISWEDFCKGLAEYERFGGAMKAENLFPDIVTELKSDNELTDHEKISRMLRAVQNRVKWNRQHALFCSEKGLQNVMKDGEGNSADMNFLLYCALRDMGYPVFPVLLNPRYKGELPEGSPDVEKVNGFILLVKGRDSQNYYVDASDLNAFVNAIPPSLQIPNAHYFSTKGNPTPINLTGIATNQMAMTQLLSIDEESHKIKGFQRFKYNNALAYINNCEYNLYGNEEEYIGHILMANNLASLSNFKRSVSETAAIVEEYNFEKETTEADRHVINPWLSMVNLTLEFNETNRQLPVEFVIPESYNLTSTFTIPEGWEIEEAPKPSILNYGENDITFSTNFSVSSNAISSQVRLKINRINFEPEEYSDLADYFAEQSAILHQPIIIKKK